MSMNRLQLWLLSVIVDSIVKSSTPHQIRVKHNKLVSSIENHSLNLSLFSHAFSPFLVSSSAGINYNCSPGYIIGNIVILAASIGSRFLLPSFHRRCSEVAKRNEISFFLVASRLVQEFYGRESIAFVSAVKNWKWIF
jgi:hypothetical protein